MEYNYSSRMNELKKKQPSILVQMIIILLIISFGVIGYFSYKEGKEASNLTNDDASDFVSDTKTMGNSKLNPMFLSEAFASNYNDSILYCFAIGKDYKPYVVAIRAEDIAQYQDLIDYTYTEAAAETPAPVTLFGVQEEYNEDMKNLTIEAFREFWGDNTVDENTFRFIFGNYYLDTTQGNTADNSLLYLMIFGILVLIAIYFFLLMKGKKSATRCVATLEKYQGSKLNEIDLELTDPSTTVFKKQKLYFTQNNIVTGSFGLDIIPYEEIVHVYGILVDKNRNQITATTRDGDNHIIAEIYLNNRGDELYSQIIDQIKSVMPDIKYGFEDGYFTKTTTADILEVDEASEGKSSNMPLGIIGAILGAALGGVIWIIIGKLGFIAGIAGFAMMYFAIKGYRKFSGLLDKKGQIISLIIAFIMIFVANYTSYALEYCKYFYSGVYSITNLYHSLTDLIEFLKYSGTLGDFLKDLAIGYGLSIWAGFSIIKTVFQKNS